MPPLEYVLYWMSEHTPPRPLYYTESTLNGLVNWGATPELSQAKRFKSISAASRAYRCKHHFRDNYIRNKTYYVVALGEPHQIPLF